MRARGAARQPGDQPARVGPPLRRAEPRQCRDEGDAVGRFHARREPLALRGRLDHAETVAEPLQRRAADEYGALGRVLRRAPRRYSCRRRQQALHRGAHVPAERRQHERPRPVRRLGLAGSEARLPEERRLLVAGDPRDGTRAPRRHRLRDEPRRGHDPGQHLRVDAEEREQLVVPGAGGEVEEQRPGRVRHVRDVRGAMRQLPHEPGVDRPEASSSRGRSTRARIHSSFVAEK
jgi:hypothetical protein